MAAFPVTVKGVFLSSLIAASFVSNNELAMAAKPKKASEPATSRKSSDDPACRETISRAATLFANRKSAEAAELLKSWRSKCPGNMQLHLLLSTILLRLGSGAEAEEAARQATAINPTSIAARMQYALTLMIGEKKEEAVSQFEKVVELDPASYEGWSSLSKLYFELKDEEKSKFAGDRASSVNPQSLEVRLRSVRKIAQTGGGEALRAEIKKLMERTDIGVEFYDGLAKEALNAGAYPEAIEAASKVLAGHPHAISPLKTRAKAEVGSGQYAAALTTLEGLQKSAPEDAELYAYKALAQIRMGRVKESATSLEEALNRQPRLSIALLAAGLLAYGQGDFKTATEKLEAALAADPNVSGGHLALGHVYMANSQFEDAVSEAREALRMKWQEPAALGLEAQALAMPGNKTGSLAAAEQLTRRALALEPENPDALLASATCQLRSNNANAAAAKIAQVLSKRPGSVEACRLLYKVAQAPGSKDLSTLLNAIDNRQPEINYTLARVLEQLGDTSESIKQYKSSVADGLTGAEGKAAEEAIQRLQGKGSGTDSPEEG